MDTHRPSTFATGSANEKRLREWIIATKLDNVPTNQVGGASRTAIMKMIGASRSTAQSNPRIAALFEGLDTALLNREAATLASRDNRIKEPDSSGSQQLLLALQGEIAALRAKVRRLEWRDDTGLSIRE